MSKTALKRAIKKANGQSELARICGVTQPSVWGWLHKRNGLVPAEYVPAIEAATGVKRHELRPDLWQAERAA